ncbi:MAG: HD domain-containing protein [Candidatus Devosia phytovorans]|uniref:HD domain-containing protein n=1 Tax=Candidatus Devosia phytovorans TaxID=3121372 RepID=A0AAJ5VSG7_9HYPH|nr:HD domain-containing phosphohydrolase [Devosia sp.]WEK02733.1 MAG: HD domain-containing protein [Devosia sp.]
MLNTYGRGSVILLVYEDNADNNATLARETGAQAITLDEFSGNHLANDPNIVIRVALSNLDTVRKLKAVLANRGKGRRIFLVDLDKRVTSVHAAVLGADVLLAEPASSAEINKAVREQLNLPADSPHSVAVMNSIGAGITALDASFKAIIAGAQLDTEGAQLASEQIADAVTLAGINDWLATVKGYHFGTFQHCMLVTGMASAFGSKTGMSRQDVMRLTLAGLLHDIGKAVVPLRILDKPGALDPDEQAIMQVHPVAGYDYLKQHSTIDAQTLASVRHHHEALDGSGYPDHLAGEQIDDLTRIITICDIYAALIEKRSYKEAKTPRQALTILNAMAADGKVEASLVRALGNIVMGTKVV